VEQSAPTIRSCATPTPTGRLPVELPLGPQQVAVAALQRSTIGRSDPYPQRWPPARHLHRLPLRPLGRHTSRARPDPPTHVAGCVHHGRSRCRGPAARPVTHPVDTPTRETPPFTTGDDRTTTAMPPTPSSHSSPAAEPTAEQGSICGRSAPSCNDAGNTCSRSSRCRGSSRWPGRETVTSSSEREMAVRKNRRRVQPTGTYDLMASVIGQRSAFCERSGFGALAGQS
jgi:hypothetical protein